MRKSTSDAAQIQWVQKVYDGAVLDDAEAKRLDSLLLGRLDHLDRHLAARPFLVGDRFGIADVSVLPRVAMYPWIGLSIGAGRHPHVRRWLDANESRESFVASVAPPG